MPLNQESRLLAIETALGPNALAIRTMSLHEQLSQPFQIEVELSSEAGEINLDDVVGHEASIRLDCGARDKRFFHGIVNRMAQVTNVGGHAHYRASIVPWLWFLTRTSDCRIFQNLSVPAIIEQIFKDLGFADYQLHLGQHEPKEYCVQYRETSFNFVSRLMEQEGIYYYFQHQADKHTLMLVDSISGHKPCPGYAEIPFHELERGAAQREVITEWREEKDVQSVAYGLRDFDFQKPKTPLEVLARKPRKHGQAVFEMFDYPGEYLAHGDGERLADVRLDELQSQGHLLHGRASARGLTAGGTFALKGHPRPDQNGEYLITAASLQVDAGEYASGPQAGEFFTCRFSAIPKDQQFRPPRVTPKPIVQGPQTAIVVGPAGEEIHTEKHGCVKVHFHWDRHDHSDENSSCWIRVSQTWAGKEWGTIHIPRMGQEVIVEFLEGDPDRPIITGRVYNADQMPPYALPANKTQSGIKSRSSKAGASANFNQIRFEDKKGSEEINIHAEKDQNNLVENNETTWVGHDRLETVDHDETIHIKHDRTETVDNNESITIGANRTESVGQNETISIGVDRSETVGANESITVGANRTRQVGQNEDVTVALMRTHTVGVNEAITIGAAQEITVGAMQAVTVGASQSNTIGVDRTTSVGKEDTLSVGKKLTIEAGDEILIKTGKASIHMKKDGTIAIKGKDITIEGSGEIKAKASKKMTLKGQKILEN